MGSDISVPDHCLSFYFTTFLYLLQFRSMNKISKGFYFLA